jgi:hypothetical protein
MASASITRPPQSVTKITRDEDEPAIRRLILGSMGPKTWEGTHAPRRVWIALVSLLALAGCAEGDKGDPGQPGGEGRARRRWNGRPSRPSWAQGRGAIIRQPVEDLMMDWIGGLEPLFVVGIAALLDSETGGTGRRAVASFSRSASAIDPHQCTDAVFRASSHQATEPGRN